MQKCKCFLVVLVTIVFSFSVTALSWADEVDVDRDGGMVAPSETKDLNLDLMKDERLLDLEEKYAANYEALVAEIQAESDPLKREQLQKEVHALKENRQIEVKELQLELAIEKGDQARELELLDALDALQKPQAVTPSIQEPRQQPEDGSIKPKSPSKNPDDA